MIVSRSRLAACALCAFSLASFPHATAGADAPRTPVTKNPPSFPPISPEQALALLTEGNARFVSGKSAHPRQTAKHVAQASEAQHPFVTVLSCSDSRVPPEVIFDEGIGDVFSVRVAGNVADTDEMGSVEYGVGHLETPLFVVMGHTKCGAVNAVASRAIVHGHIPELVDNISPVVEAARKRVPKASPADLVAEAIRGNVFHAMATVLRDSEGVRATVRSGKAQVVGAIYDIGTGRVEWLGRHPDEAVLLATERQMPNGHGPPASSAEASHGASAAPSASIGAHGPTAPPAGHDPHPPAENPLRSTPAALAVVALLCTLAGTISGRLSAARPSTES